MIRPTHSKFIKELLQDPATKKAYDELEEEFDIIIQLIKARKMAGKSQIEVAKAMHTSASAISRLEAGITQQHHSPSLATLMKYAKAVDCKLKIKFVPNDNTHM